MFSGKELLNKHFSAVLALLLHCPSELDWELTSKNISKVKTIALIVKFGFFFLTSKCLVLNSPVISTLTFSTYSPQQLPNCSYKLAHYKLEITSDEYWIQDMYFSKLVISVCLSSLWHWCSVGPVCRFDQTLQNRTSAML